MDSLAAMNALKLSHRAVKARVRAGDFCIDATAGNGGDTAFLAELVGEEGRVLAFDIQEQAVKNTTQKLKEQNLLSRCEVHKSGHEHMDDFAAKDSADCIMFNFGWLPGGDHHLGTRTQTSIEALSKALQIVKPGGIISLCLYYGGLTGFEERDALLSYFEQIDSKNYTVLFHQFINRKGCPPLFVLIERHKS